MIRRYLKIMGEITQAYPLLIIFNVISLVLGLGATYLNLLLPKWVLDAVAQGHLNHGIKIIFFAVLYNIAVACYARLTSIKKTLCAEQMNIANIDSYLRHILSISTEQRETKNFLDRHALLMSKCCEVYNQCLSLTFQTIEAILGAIMTTVVLFWVSPLILALLMTFVILQSLVRHKTNDYEYTYSIKMTEQRRKLQFLYNLFLMPDFMRDFSLNRYRTPLLHKKDQFNAQVLNVVREKQRPIVQMSFLSALLTCLESLGVLVWFASAVSKNTIAVADFFICFNAYQTLKGNITTLIGMGLSLSFNDRYLCDLIQMREQMPPDHRQPLRQLSSIDFENVSYHYPQSSANVLDHFNLHIHQGEKILIRGANGKGKSTLIDLILGLRLPSEGQIRYNQTQATSFTHNVGEQIAEVFQNASLYPFTVEENVTLFDNEKKGRATAQAQLLHSQQFWEDHKDRRISSQFGDQGSNLSGGQAQLVFILRALTLGTKWIIFDEPTKGLDSSMEKIFFDFIKNDKEHTLILVTHSQIDTSIFDQIIDF